jgi:predicted RNA-binding Zn-ribbon protein involved in translation (DUF1610 family)
VTPSIQQKKYTCSDCGKTFQKPQALAGHRHVHGDQQRPQTSGVPAAAGSGARVACPLCGQTFTATSNLAQHFRYRHPGKSMTAVVKKPAAVTKASVAKQSADHTCPHCGQKFGIAHNLGQHLKFRHPDKTAVKAAVPRAAAPVAVLAKIAAEPGSPLEHLQMALQNLTQRESAINGQLDALQTEKASVAKQIDLVNAALAGFGR